ncbi:hypothetical protein HC752_23580 [Vibrio sp. S9_S30]|uniref:hypothetical protein n=1 Tax=Vibrio sp. S9_S30 TaxID=2720226 RepID=UPI001680141D|nr:hypothetical protein [Vibrio sp. S9_S30]MBD1559909.1 hypothetical protein [Vibrio sp. S9_S30]
MLYKSLSRFLSVFVTLLLLIKFFTATVVFSDDPYSFFVFKTQPSLYNKFVVTSDEEFNEFIIILSDENKLIGQDVYSCLMSSTVIVSLSGLLLLVFVAGMRLSKRNKK